MDLFKSGNPTLSEKRFKDTVLDDVVNPAGTMTVRGTLNKFGILFILMMSTAFYAWKEFSDGGRRADTLDDWCYRRIDCSNCTDV